MKKLIIAAMFVLAGCTGPLINLSTINPGMTKQEVITLLGQPESASVQNSFSYLYFRVHDKAFGRDNNHYIFAFKNEKLVEFAPLPDDQQEMGPIDRALRRRNGQTSSNGGNGGNSYIQTPNAYGPGIHSDQYGRPVQVVPQ